MANTDLSAEQLREHLTFDHETGIFTSLVTRKKGPNPWQAGEEIQAKAGTFLVLGQSISISKLAWLYHYGAWPKTKLVFINGDCKDLRIANLMERSDDAELTAGRLKSLLDYDPETGVFTRKIRTSNRITVGDVAGFLHVTGYWVIKIDGKAFKGHRLAWLYIYGCWPTHEIDHINGDPADNRIENLRDITHAHNVQNLRKARSDNASGFLGVHKVAAGWKVNIQLDHVPMKLGTYDTPEEAHQVYLEAKRLLHVACTI